MNKYNKLYKYHDITKAGDYDSFSNYPHGETAYKLWEKGMFPDKRIYDLPKAEQEMIAQAFQRHTDIRFNIKSLIKDAETGKLQIPKERKITKENMQNKVLRVRFFL